MTDARHDVWTHARKMWAAGLVTGSSGNISRRVDGQHVAITPTSVAYDAMEAADIVLVDLSTGRPVDSRHEPSYELPLHLGIYRSRPDVHAIVHTHAPYVTTLSILHRPLPPVLDEMVVRLGGTIELAEYAFTGTEGVATNVLRALGDRTGAILANHGNVCIGRDLQQALDVALVMEAGARAYVQALHIGTPVALPRDAVIAGRHLFESRNKLP